MSCNTFRSCLLFATLLLANAPLAASQSDRWLFRVYLDDREIGFHEFSVSQRDGRQVVDIAAEFDVKFLFFNAYSYDHHNEERWVGDCLDTIEALTNDNGTQYAVSGHSSESGFEVRVNLEKTHLKSDCLRSFAYWNPVILESKVLLNSQTGEVVDVNVVEHGDVTYDLGPNRMPAEKFTIEMEGGPIHLWYSRGNRNWLALEAETEGGRTLRYVPENLPAHELGNTRLVMD
jgi:hypothetical protein